MTQGPTVFRRIKNGSMAMLTMALFSFLAVLLGWSAPASVAAGESAGGCPVDMVQVGPLCVDKYEASVWSRPPARDGKPRGTQFGLPEGIDYPCSVNGSDCSDANPIFAVSVPGKTPSAFITWFQAQQACLNVGKRLPTNAEWQGAATGTPTDYEPDADDGADDCNTSTANLVVPTGSRRNCVSSFGAFDMVGNVFEWTADWIQGSTVPFTPSVGTAGPDFGDDFMRGTNPAIGQGFGTNFPGALVRGGSFHAGVFSPNGSGAGVFALNARFSPADAGDDGGFRCVR
jgi:formylglycine-generating enzyme required for sulfatase activity